MSAGWWSTAMMAAVQRVWPRLVAAQALPGWKLSSPVGASTKVTPWVLTSGSLSPPAVPPLACDVPQPIPTALPRLTTASGRAIRRHDLSPQFLIIPSLGEHGGPRREWVAQLTDGCTALLLQPVQTGPRHKSCLLCTLVKVEVGARLTSCERSCSS